MTSLAFNRDCMEAMREFPDKFFDIAVVDPPYGVGTVTYMPRTREKAFGGYVDKYDITVATIDINQRSKVKVDVVHSKCGGKTVTSFGDENVSPCPEYFEELFRVSKNQVIWGGNYFLLPPSRGFIVWRKTTVSESFSMAMCEYAWMSFNTNAKVFEASPQGTTADPRVHPTQKPIELYAWILKNYAKPGDKILDTHLGSGSSRIAAYDAGLDFWGYEIDKDYFELQEERFAKHAAQISLFIDEIE
jgi:site-specific DNA-methyltransferase (adenine-specific)